VSDLARTLLLSLDPDDLVLLADMLEPYRQRGHAVSGADAGDEWLDLRSAAEHLAMPRNAVQRLASERRIPSHHEGPNCKHYFKRRELDEWREAGGARSRAVGRP